MRDKETDERGTRRKVKIVMRGGLGESKGRDEKALEER